MEEGQNERIKNFVRVELKLSSSKGEYGYSILTQHDGSISEAQLQEIAQRALNVALKAESALKKVKNL